MALEQPNNPLHGVTLEAMLKHLVRELGWNEMARRVEIRCFMFDPTITSSLRFLRRTPWARQKVEEIYVETRRHRTPTPPPAESHPRLDGKARPGVRSPSI